MNRALLIDRNYMALAIITWTKVVKLLVKGKAEPIVGGQNYTYVKTSSGLFGIPPIVRLLMHIPWKAHQSRMKFSKRNIMIRDNFECQYCNTRMSKTGGTIDHVIPKTKGGESTYTNCVACCKACNNMKGSRLLEEIGMKLKTKPKRPGFTTIYKNYLDEYVPEEWNDYIIGV